MAAGAAAAAAITAGANFAGQMISGGMSRRKAGRQFRHNMKLAEYNYDRQYEMWDEAWRRETEYNDPKAQMQRYRDAGLNPHLVASGGVNNQASTGQLPQYAQEANDVGGLDSIDFGGILGQYVSTKSQLTAVRQQEAQARILEAQASKDEAGLGFKVASEAAKAESDNRYRHGDRGPGKLTGYEQQLNAEQEYQQLQNLATKAQQKLSDATAKNLLSNDEMIEIQTDILRGQAAFLKSETWKKLPAGLQAVLMALAKRFGGM